MILKKSEKKGKRVKKRKNSEETEKNDVKRRNVNDILVNTMTTNQNEFVVKKNQQFCEKTPRRYYCSLQKRENQCCHAEFFRQIN